MREWWNGRHACLRVEALRKVASGKFLAHNGRRNSVSPVLKKCDIKIVIEIYSITHF